MLSIILITTLSIVVVALAIFIVKLLRVIEANKITMADVYAELLNEQGDSYQETLERILRSKFENERGYRATIRNLENSIEVLHSELNDMEKILQMEQSFAQNSKQGHPNDKEDTPS